MFHRQSLSLLILFFSFFALPPVAPAAEDATQARRVIENSSEQIKQTLKQPAYQKDFDKSVRFVDGIVTEFADMPRVALLVLGKNIRQATPEQRQRFIEEFKTLLVRTYTRAFLDYKDWSLTFKPYADDRDDGRTIVKTVVHQPGQQPVEVSYRMLLNKQGEWKVYDIIIGGVSLVTNYRTSFNQEIAQTGSIDSVIQKLVDKNSKPVTDDKG
ncbi:phospholipid-binding protein MlaC [Methylobacter sp. BBA5.1]|uniref:MlaC/ttg2D family ABC transporter substrate-binding protein n=1 Tax=Methylobacter sp. BBA5.1 TaxID=1495064 RepID=UPI00056A2D36|nr:ABC transporter substrate-binding protein [Methylobacter sp. BBA5.1]